ncbi:MAG: hypothetical protein AAE983_06000 [Thermoplasmataceae archaeon]|jgi:hypothetical protein
MNKKTKILGAIIGTSDILLLAFTGIMTHIQSRKDVGLDSNVESNFITVYNALDSKFGTNVEVYFSTPSSWQYIVSVMEGWT